MKTIPLTKGVVALVDDEDYAFLSQWKWHETSGYAARWERQGSRRVSVKMHRQILNAPEGMDVDHINGNRADNRRHNIRIVSTQVNMRNLKMNKRNTSGCQGVTFLKPKNKRCNGLWIARIGKGMDRVYLGAFHTFDEAKAARTKAEVELGFSVRAA